MASFIHAAPTARDELSHLFALIDSHGSAVPPPVFPCTSQAALDAAAAAAQAKSELDAMWQIWTEPAADRVDPLKVVLTSLEGVASDRATEAETKAKAHDQVRGCPAASGPPRGGEAAEARGGAPRAALRVPALSTLLSPSLPRLPPNRRHASAWSSAGRSCMQWR